MEQLGWNTWVGVEVEGRLRGVPTLFIRHLAENVDVDEIAAQYGHVWLCKEYIAQQGYALAFDLSQAGVLVSIEVTPDLLPNLPAAVLALCHIVLAVPVSGAAMAALKPTDTVRLDAAPADCWAITAGQLLRTAPRDYKGDRRID